MSATVTTNAWGTKAGAWARDSEEHEDELNQDSISAANNNKSTVAPLNEFPSLSVAKTAKPKKNKGTTVSLSEYIAGPKPIPSQEKVLTHEELMNLPTGPRERTAEELERSSRWGNSGGGNRSGFRVSDDQPRRQRSFGRDSGVSDEPSRADENDDWGARKTGGFGGGFERRERGERGGSFFDHSQSKADESDNWVKNKTFLPSEGRRYDRPRGVGFESNGGGERKYGAFDSLRDRRGGGFESDRDSWGKRDEVGSGGVRPKLNLKPRTLPINEEQSVTKPKGSSPFGDARPRELVLKDKGQDWKEVDEKLEAMKLKEKEAALADGLGYGRRSFGGGNGRASFNAPLHERSWKNNNASDVRPRSAEKSENGNSDGAENGNAEM